MAHNVICFICGKQFDRDKIQAVKVSARRYAHYDCKPDGELVPLPAQKQEDPDLKLLKDYIDKFYGKNANWARIMQQIKKYTIENNYSYSGILKSLKYWLEVKHMPIQQDYGAIGIVPFVYQQAYNYYYSLFLAEQQNINKNVKEITNKEREIIIDPPQVKTKKRLFTFLEEDTDGE